MEETNNVTHRQKQRSNSLHDISSYNSSLLDTTMLSIPNSSLLNDSQCISELNEKINTLGKNLSNAHQEIENLNTENIRLKLDLGKALSRIEALENLITTKDKFESRTLESQHNITTAENDPKQKTYQALEQGSEHRSYDKTKLVLPEDSRKTAENSKPLSSKSDKPSVTKNKKKIFVIADQQGRNIRKILQDLVGSNYSVACFWKPGARMQEVLGTYKTFVSKLTFNDFVIILGGTNDSHPGEFQFYVRELCKYTTNTNVIFCEIPHNNILREEKLNYDLRFTCNDFENVCYVDMNYSKFIPNRRSFAVNICRSILKEIVQHEYKIKLTNYNNYILTKKQKPINVIDKSTQTDLDTIDCDVMKIDNKSCNDEVQTDYNTLRDNLCKSDNNFFRT